MNFERRQWIHWIGIITMLVVGLLIIDRMYFRKPPTQTANMGLYTWLATVNMHQKAAFGFEAIQRGEASMLVIPTTDAYLLRAKLDRQKKSDQDIHALSLQHVNHKDDTLIDHADPLYEKLFLATLVDSHYSVVPLRESPIRAVRVYRKGPSVVYSAILTDGRAVPTEESTRSRVYSPLLDR